MFKPGHAKQQFEHLKQGRNSEPEIMNYQTQPAGYPQ